MQPYNKAVMTDKAIELLNKAQAGLCQIEITRMAIGDGEYLSAEKKEEYLKGQLELKNEKNSYPISSKGVSSDNSIIITAILSNQDPITFETLVEKGYCISEIGIFAKENGSDDEILYSIAVAENLGDYMPAFEGSNPAQIIQSYQITVNNMETGEVAINYTGAALLASDGQNHFTNTKNPHNVSKSQVGLGNVDNTSDKDKPISDATQEALDAINSNLEKAKEVETGTFEKLIEAGTYSNEYLCKKDGIVHLSLRLHSTSVTGFTTIWAKLPEGFRPHQNTWVSGYAKINGTSIPISMNIYASGAIPQSYGAVEATELSLCGSFILGE